MSGIVTDADFEADGRNASSGESAFDFDEHEASEAATAVFRGDADGGDMADAVGFDNGDGEGDHFVIDGTDLAGNSVGI